MEPNFNQEKRNMKHFHLAPRDGKNNCLYHSWLLLAAIAVSASGCVTGGSSSTSGHRIKVPEVGPQLSSSAQRDPSGRKASGLHLPKINVVVPVFDPNIPEDSDTWEKLGIFPELRRAEANRFALKMKSALHNTNAFGTVKVVPNATATADLYIIGKIIQSTGEDVEINIAAVDISGRQWFAENFNHQVKEGFHSNLRNKGKDAYDPVFQAAAAHVIEKLKAYSSEELEKLQLLSQLRFGSSLSEETFTQYLKSDGRRVELISAPADDDPMLRRIQSIYVRDQLFIDNLQAHYADFDRKMDESYLVWQQQSLVEGKAARKAKKKAMVQKILGGALIIAGVVGAVKADNTASEVVSVGALGAGGALAIKGFQTSAEMKVHREALAELGESIDIELAPRVIEYENETTKLVGDAAEQYGQWGAFLKKIYALEATPTTQL